MGQIVSDVTSILDYKNNKQAAKTKRQEILQSIANDEKNKVNLIKKALSAQRAKYGASGMSGRGMTEQAVLQRIQNETSEPFEDKKRKNIEKLKNIKTNKPNILKSLLSRFDELMA